MMFSFIFLIPYFDAFNNKQGDPRMDKIIQNFMFTPTGTTQVYLIYLIIKDFHKLIFALYCHVFRHNPIHENFPEV